MGMIRSYKELTVWQKSIDLVQTVYELTCKFPKEEVYGLSSQMRRATISISSNIAERQRRKDLPEYLQFLRIFENRRRIFCGAGNPLLLLREIRSNLNLFIG
jgi:hypothetical protein